MCGFFYLVIVLSSRTAGNISICYADLSSDAVYYSADCIQLIYAVEASVDTVQDIMLFLCFSFSECACC